MKQPTNQGDICAGFFPRFSAFMLDSLITGCVVGGFRLIKGLFEMQFSNFLLFKNLLFEFDLFDIVFYIMVVMYFVLLTSLTGTTIGKRAFNLAVVDAEGNKITFWNAVYRETIGRYLSSMLFIGYIMIMIDKKDRALHDFLCDTQVIYTVKMRRVEQERKPEVNYGYAPMSYNQGRPIYQENRSVVMGVTNNNRMPEKVNNSGTSEIPNTLETIGASKSEEIHGDIGLSESSEIFRSIETSESTETFQKIDSLDNTETPEATKVSEQEETATENEVFKARDTN